MQRELATAIRTKAKYCMKALMPANNWPLAKKLVFRFFFLYFLLYCFPFPFDLIGPIKPVVQTYFRFQDAIVKKIGDHLLHIPVQGAFPGFDKMDDSYYGVTFLLANLVVSLGAAIIWSLIDWSRSNYTRLFVWFQLYLRYFLGTYLLMYGFAKFFPSQFQEVTASRLVMEVGEQTPMLMAWNFMGYSVIFNRIISIIEIVAGILLFFRRTTTLGALLATITFSFVTLIDYCFNVPIKLFASHLLLISLLLILIDAKRLLSVLILNSPVEAMTYPPLFKNEQWRKWFAVFQALCIAGILYKTIVDSIGDARQWGRYAPRVPLYGIYQTKTFIRNNDTIPPLETDSLRWKQLVIDGGSWKQSGLIKFSNDHKIFYKIKTDTLLHTLHIQKLTDTLVTYNFHFAQPGADYLLLEGMWNKDSVKVLLSKSNPDSLPLLRDRFRILSE